MIDWFSFSVRIKSHRIIPRNCRTQFEHAIIILAYLYLMLHKKLAAFLLICQYIIIIHQRMIYNWLMETELKSSFFYFFEYPIYMYMYMYIYTYMCVIEGVTNHLVFQNHLVPLNINNTPTQTFTVDKPIWIHIITSILFHFFILKSQVVQGTTLMYIRPQTNFRMKWMLQDK